MAKKRCRAKRRDQAIALKTPEQVFRPTSGLMSEIAISRQLKESSLVKQCDDEDQCCNKADGDQTVRPSFVLVTEVSNGDQHPCDDRNHA